MECPTIQIRNLPSSCGQSIRQDKYTIQGRSIYKNGDYFGLILYNNKKKKKLGIRVRNGNKFMNGQIVTVKY